MCICNACGLAFYVVSHALSQSTWVDTSRFCRDNVVLLSHKSGSNEGGGFDSDVSVTTSHDLANGRPASVDC